jgi:coiled-coil domain-containing protein 55
MSGLKFNFNKPKPATKPTPRPVASSKTAFDDSDEEDNVLTKPAKSSKPKQAAEITGLNEDLRTYTSLSEETAARMAQEALEQDPSVFDYDAVYDELKIAQNRKKEIAEKDREERKPKYMETILASAEVRKRDYLIAQERKYQKEREVEGEEFSGKEKFVTSAYKRQQEEMRQAEEEEKLREKKAREKSQGMAGFYRNMLEEEENKHELAVKAASAAVKEGKVKKSEEEIEAEITREKQLADEARRLNAELGEEVIAINDDGEVVDKRQLLKGGLNVKPKPKPQLQTGKTQYEQEYEARREAQRNVHKEREARERQRRVIEEQYELKRKRAQDEEKAKEEELMLRVKSKKTSDEVMSARERYLARKNAAAAAQGV